MAVTLEDVKSLPYIFQSEEKIAAEAKYALAFLKRCNAMDIADILGLDKFLEEEQTND